MPTFFRNVTRQDTCIDMKDSTQDTHKHYLEFGAFASLLHLITHFVSYLLLGYFSVELYMCCDTIYAFQTIKHYKGIECVMHCVLHVHVAYMYCANVPSTITRITHVCILDLCQRFKAAVCATTLGIEITF